jgi:GT2 family glycosyltransferase
VDFIGGRCLPRWSQPPPPWLPREFPAVIGWIDQGSEVRRFDDPGFDAMLMGGNAVVRRSLFERAGLYSRVLGPGKTGSGEDYEIYRRFLAAGAEGLYVPDLVVYHHVPAERLRRSYYRQWVFRNGVSLAALDAIQPEPVPRLFGAPRWFVRRGLNGLAQWAIHALLRGPGSPQAFCGQLRFIRLLGFLYAAPRGGLARRAMEHTG